MSDADWRPADWRPRPGVTITVMGQPAPQGSKRAFAVRGKGGVPTGRVAVIESSHDRVKSWRQAIIDACGEAMTADYNARLLLPVACASRFPLGGPLAAAMVFSLRRPKSHYRTGRNARLLRDGAPARPDTAPDLSKLCRASEDALEAVGLFGNDAQITEYTRLAKVFCGEDSDALDVPGAVIVIRQVAP